MQQASSYVYNGTCRTQGGFKWSSAQKGAKDIFSHEVHRIRRDLLDGVSSITNWLARNQYDAVVIEHPQGDKETAHAVAYGSTICYARGQKDIFSHLHFSEARVFRTDRFTLEEAFFISFAPIFPVGDWATKAERWNKEPSTRFMVWGEQMTWFGSHSHDLVNFQTSILDLFRSANPPVSLRAVSVQPHTGPV